VREDKEEEGGGQIILFLLLILIILVGIIVGYFFYKKRQTNRVRNGKDNDGTNTKRRRKHRVNKEPESPNPEGLQVKAKKHIRDEGVPVGEVNDFDTN